MEEIFYFDENYAKRAKWCNENDCHIQEIEADKLGRRFQIVRNPEIDVAQQLRQERVDVCFPIVNRGKLWYDSLSDEKLAQLQTWYLQWLDAPQTKIRPKDLEWLN